MNIRKQGNKNLSAPLVFNKLEFDEQVLIDSLFQYIKKNTFIPKFIASINPNDKHLADLLDAIKSGNDQAEIFADKDCYLYLLYLMKNKPEQVPFWQGVTVYFYLMTLMQYTTKQALNPCDDDVKFLHDIAIDRLTKESELTDEGIYYLQSVCKKLKEIGVISDFDEISNFVLSLPETERWLFRLPFKPSDNLFVESKDQNGILNKLLTSTAPHIIKCNDSSAEKIKTYWVPSASLFNYISQRVSVQPIIRLPIFGSVSADTLAELHIRGLHPYPLYSPHVKSNLKESDGYRCGPVVNAIHDDSHTIWGSMLTPVERNVILNSFVPQLKIIKSEAKTNHFNNVEGIIENIIRMLLDFDLLSTELFSNPKTRLSVYITDRFNYFFRREIHDLSIESQGQLICLINKMLLSVNGSDLDSAIWQSILLNACYVTKPVWSNPKLFEDVASSLSQELFTNLPKARNYHDYETSPLRKNSDRSDSSNPQSTKRNERNFFEEITNTRFARSITFNFTSRALGDNFYIVGNPVPLKKPLFVNCLFWSLRDNISKKEIQESLPVNGVIKLFKSRHDAVMFAEISAKGDKYLDKDYARPAVFEVKLLTDLTHSNPKKAKMIVVDDHVDDTSLSEAKVCYLETDASNVIPLSGQISIRTFAGIKDYPAVDDFDLKNANQPS